MPRTPSSTTFLLTAAAAVTAVTATGCVSVRPPATPKAPSPSVSAPAPRPEGHADHHPVVQAPAREAMEQLKPSTPQHTPAQRTEQQPRAATPAPPRMAPRATPAPHRTTVPEPRTAPETRHVKKAPKAPAQADVCALGRRYGGWDRDSPQSAICRDTYGG